MEEDIFRPMPASAIPPAMQSAMSAESDAEEMDELLLLKKAADSAEAIAAASGRKKYGKERFQKMAARGLRRHWRTGK